jgi:hypothetical protein
METMTPRGILLMQKPHPSPPTVRMIPLPGEPSPFTPAPLTGNPQEKNPERKENPQEGVGIIRGRTPQERDASSDNI